MKWNSSSISFKLHMEQTRWFLSKSKYLPFSIISYLAFAAEKAL